MTDKMPAAISSIRLADVAITTPNQYDQGETDSLSVPDRISSEYGVQIPAEAVQEFTAMCALRVTHFIGRHKVASPSADSGSSEAEADEVETVECVLRYEVGIKLTEMLAEDDEETRRRLALWVSQVSHPYFRQTLLLLAAQMDYPHLKLRILPPALLEAVDPV
ncbi:hypothetical protein [Pseudoclavibacter sp. RFBA6]|uniref:hypothetical protein n=1 Tax=Pseudoclavibacter sp. RFBA6 TaxID=2080573 RepID=UPI000CE91553|nr:hypothetical protein [Pseudoclavibacter sp. RFBA6]PPG39487.1 hypothetical protein C5C17_11900 [Pseudoclavibacter sp. RFBA6]